MSSYKKTLILPHKMVGLFKDWNKVHSAYTSSCMCTAINTDMESYIEVEALDLNCLQELCEQFVQLGFEYFDTEVDRERSKSRRKN